MPLECRPPSELATLIQECTNLSRGKQLHLEIAETGHDKHKFLGNLLIHMYGKCGSLKDAHSTFERIRYPNLYSYTILMYAYIRNGRLEQARNVFDAMPSRDIVSWNAIIGAYAQEGHRHEALKLLSLMDLQGVNPNDVTLFELINGCTCLSEARVTHKLIRKEVSSISTKVGNALVSMYAKCGSVEDVRKTFDAIEDPNVVTWTLMITAYARNGHLLEACNIFTRMPFRNEVSWNSMLSAYAQHGNHREALHMYKRMLLEGVPPTEITFICTLEAVASLRRVRTGVEVHKTACEGGFLAKCTVPNALVNMYGKCGRLDTAREIFEGMNTRDTMSWNVMILVEGMHNPRRGLEIYWRMNNEGAEPSAASYVTVLDFCSELREIRQGKLIHERALQTGVLNTNVVLDTAIVTMYGRCGESSEARRVFDLIEYRDIVCWTAMLTAYVQNGHAEESLVLLARIDLEGIVLTPVTFVSCIVASSVINCVRLTRELCDGALDKGYESHESVATALIDAFGKLGCVLDAMDAFLRGPQHCSAIWNVMITAFAENQMADEGVVLFQEMCLQGVFPNEITFTNVLSASSHHAGMTKDVWSYFVSMSGDHGVNPGIDHYACLVDLLGRSGRLGEAEELMNNMPYEPDFAAWTSFLDACKGDKDSSRGQHAAQTAFLADPNSSGPYVLLSNLHKRSSARLSS